jgi:hypothetical protein
MRAHRDALIALVFVLGCGGRESTVAAKGKELAPPLDSRRVTVEVLNPGKQVGVARTATLRLRQQGLDVVYFGSLADTVLAKRERNLIYVRRGDTTGVGRVIAAIGDAEVVDRADATRLVDLTVIPGRGFLTPRLR